MSGLFGTDFSILEAALAARERMQSIHASNIANADTPNYRSDTRTFSDLLQEEMARKVQSGSNAAGGLLTKPKMALEQRLDGNSVDVQKEMARMAENQLMHEATLRILQKKLDGLAAAIKEGGR